MADLPTPKCSFPHPPTSAAIYTDVHNAFAKNDEKTLRELISDHGAMRVAQSTSALTGTCILREISSGVAFMDRGKCMAVMARILLDSLETDELRYITIMKDVENGSIPPMFAAVHTCNLPMVDCFLDSILPDRYSDVLLSTQSRYCHITSLVGMLYTHDYRSVDLFKLFIHKAEGLDGDVLQKVYSIFLTVANEVCRLQYKNQCHIEVYTGTMILVVIESVERVYAKYPEVVDVLMSEESAIRLIHVAIEDEWSGIVNAMLRICECRYAHDLLTVQDSTGTTGMLLATTTTYPEMDELRTHVLTKPCC